MTRRLTPAHLKELRSLRDRAVFVIDFVHGRSDLGDLAERMKDAVETAFAKQNLRGLRQVSRDLREMADGLAPQHAAELATLLARRLGVDVTAESEVERAALHAIVDRGRIRNEREYRRVLDFLGRDDANLEARLQDALEELLRDYR